MTGTAPGDPDQVTVFAGRRIALLTQHGKERVIGPVFDRALGCRVERVAGYDTDLLGTLGERIAARCIHGSPRSALWGKRARGKRCFFTSLHVEDSLQHAAGGFTPTP